jgi:hypothetical protein
MADISRASFDLIEENIPTYCRTARLPVCAAGDPTISMGKTTHLPVLWRLCRLRTNLTGGRRPSDGSDLTMVAEEIVVIVPFRMC